MAPTLVYTLSFQKRRCKIEDYGLYLLLIYILRIYWPLAVLSTLCAEDPTTPWCAATQIILFGYFKYIFEQLLFILLVDIHVDTVQIKKTRK